MTALSKERLRAAACAAAVAAAMAVLLVALSALFLPKGGQQAYGTTSVEGGGVLGEPLYRFATTSDDITAFAVSGKFIFGHQLDSIEHVNLDAVVPLPDA